MVETIEKNGNLPGSCPQDLGGKDLLWKTTFRRLIAVRVDVDQEHRAGGRELVELWFTVLTPSGRRHLSLRARCPAELRHLLEAECFPRHNRGAEIRCGNKTVGVRHPIGTPPLVDGAVLTLDRPEEVRENASRHRLQVIGGPDAGTVYALRPGFSTLGRKPGVDIRILDPDVSGTHAIVAVRGSIKGEIERVEVHDARSRNGTRIGSRPVVAGIASVLGNGSLLRCGATTLRYTSDCVESLATPADGSGGLTLHQPPRLTVPDPEHEIVLPLPTTDEPRRHGLLLLPLLLSPLSGLALWAGGVTTPYLLIAVLTPLMLGLAPLAEVLGDRRRRRQRSREQSRLLTSASERRDRALAEEHRRRHREFPDPATVLEHVLRPGRLLWKRKADDPDALTLRFGLGQLPSDLVVVTGSDSTRPVLDNVPVVVSLREAGVIGVATREPTRASILRWSLAQLTALHPPGSLTLTLVVGDPDEWHWTRWVPHLWRTERGHRRLRMSTNQAQLTIRLSEIAQEIRRRRAASTGQLGQTGAGWSGSWLVLIVESIDLVRNLPVFDEILRSGSEVGVFTICGADHVLELPGRCRATVTAEDPHGRLRVAVDGLPAVEHVRLDGVGAAWAERFARCLAPLRILTDNPSSAIPSTVRFRDLAEIGSPSEIAARWRRAPRCTTTVLGTTADGPMTIDLVADGPHTLVAGTTGSGKSELLQTLVAGLALTNSPTALSFLLVDYKGGAAFAECADFPHTTGVVTDLDAHLTARALTSLGAELKRRERFLAEAGVPNLDAWLDGVGDAPTTGSLARLVVLVDEFAALADELPDFVDGLVDIARRGRSLGVHLVLATQRPHGIVSAEIRANVTLRVVLRVTDDHESLDVIDAPDAAHILASTPGRAFVKSGAPGLVECQTAQVTSRQPETAGETVQVGELTWDRICTAPSDTSQKAQPTDLTVLTSTLRQAAHELGAEIPPPPWLPPLPPVIPLSKLATTDGEQGGKSVPLGLADFPAGQRQSNFDLDLSTGEHVLIAGGPRSGRTTALRTIAGALCRSYRPEKAHLYVLDGAGSGELEVLESLPHCGVAVSDSDLERGYRLLVRLCEVVALHTARLVDDERGSAPEPRAHGEGATPPWIVFLLDSWESFVQNYERVNNGQCLELMANLLRAGARARLTVVITGGQALLASRTAGLVRHRLLLRPEDPADAALAGLPIRAHASEPPPGRALVQGDDDLVELQIAVVGGEPLRPGPVPGAVRAGSRHGRTTAQSPARPCCAGSPSGRTLGAGDSRRTRTTVDPARCRWGRGLDAGSRSRGNRWAPDCRTAWQRKVHLAPDDRPVAHQPHSARRCQATSITSEPR